MSLSIFRGGTCISPMSSTPRLHVEQEDKDTIAFSVELITTANGQEVLVKGRNGTAFLRVNFARKECTMDVLNVPHIDVAANKKRFLQEQEVTKKVKSSKD
jgi:hypothetical protein